MSEDIVDMPDVMERVQNDKELLQELFDIFQEDFVKKRQVLGEAIASKDMTKIKEIAHSLKGASGNISIKAMHAACLQMEQLAKANTFDGMEALIKSIDEKYEAFKGFAANFKKQSGAG